MKPSFAQARRLQRPAATAVLLMLLAIDACWISNSQRPPTACGRSLRWVREHLFVSRRRFIDDAHSPDLWLQQINGAVIAFDRQDDAAAMEEAFGNGILLGHATCVDERRPSGFWAPEFETHIQRLDIQGFGTTPLTASQESAARHAVVTRRPHTAAYAFQEQTTSRILWPGILHSAAAATTMGLLAWSLAWIPKLPRSMRSQRRIAAGLCPNCAYDLETGALQTCPECGWHTP